MNKSFKEQAHTALIIVIALLLILGIFAWFRSHLSMELDSAVRLYLTQNAEATAQVFHTKLNDQLLMLESQTRYFTDVDLTDYNQMKQTILSTRGIGDFEEIGVASATGATLNYNGQSSGNILLRDYFQEALSGSSSISSAIQPNDDGKKLLYLAVPIRQHEKVTGVIYGAFTREVLNHLVNTVQFTASSSNVLLSSDGTIMARTEDNPLLPGNFDNLLDLVPDARLSPDAGPQILSYSHDRQNIIVALTPVGLHNWFFATLFPESVIGRQGNRITNYMMFSILAICGVFLSLMTYLHFLSRHHLKVEQNLSEQASTDRLSGLLNKISFQEQVGMACSPRDSKGHPVPLSLWDFGALLIIDLDNFKRVNDTLGHAMGDLVIQDGARKIHSVFREGDLVGRIGGDEFAVFLRFSCAHEEDALNHIRKRASQVVSRMREDYSADGKTVPVSVSIGISIFPRDGQTYEVLYRAADQALYIAKEKGKNQYALYE